MIKDTVSTTQVHWWTLEEIRTTEGQHWVECRDGNGVLAVVSDGRGYEIGNYTATPDRWGRSTVGVDIHLSMNGSQLWVFDDLLKFNTAILKAKEIVDR